MTESTFSLGAGHNLTIRDAGRTFVDHLGLLGRSKGTIEVHQNALAQFGKFWGERDLRETMPVDLEAYAKQVKERVSRETAYVYLSSVRSLFRFLVERHILLVDPAVRIPLPRMTDRLTGHVLTRDEMKRLIEAPDPTKPVGLRDRAMLEFLYSTGLRAGELRRVRVADLGDESVTVREGKGAQDRAVPVGARAMAWVRRYLAEARPVFAREAGATDELWLTEWGNPYGESLLQLHLRKLGDAAGIEHLTCHMVRRSMATHLLSAGASPLEVSAILGHGDLKSLSRYIQVLAREAKDTHARTHPRETS